MNFIFAILVVTASLSLYSCQTCSFESNIDFRSIPNTNDISYQLATSAQQCCNLCSADPTGACQVWTWVQQTNVCWFKTSVGFRLASTGRFTGVRQNTIVQPPPTATTCTYESEVVYQNNDISQPVTLPVGSSQVDCCSRCQITPGCVAWSYVVAQRLCYLKSASHSIVNRLNYPGSFSGSLSTTIVQPPVVPPTVSGTCTFESDFVYQNNDISQPVVLPVGSSQVDCCSRCQITPGCVAWSFVVAQRLCYLKRASHTIANRLSYPGSFSGSLSTTTIVQPPTTGNTICSVSNGFIYPGSDLTASFLNSQTECCNFCGQTAGCVAWDYLNDSRFCYLKNALPTSSRRVAYQNAASGIKM